MPCDAQGHVGAVVTYQYLMFESVTLLREVKLVLACPYNAHWSAEFRPTCMQCLTPPHQIL